MKMFGTAAQQSARICTIDGSKKSELVSNFIKYGIDLYTGSVAGEPYNTSELDVSDENGETIQNNSSETYREIATFNSFDSADATHFRNCMIYGWSLETYAFVDSTNIVTPRDPLAWHRVYNSDGELIGLINMSKIDKGSFFGDELLKDDLHIMAVYNDSQILTYHKTKGTNSGDWYEPDGFPPVQHFYGAVPGVVFRINENYETHITDDLIGQQDEYNDIDSVLAIIGYNAKHIQDNAATIREFKLLPLPEGGSANFISKNTDDARIESRLKRTRENIFMALAVPDISEIVGATGATSGIALQLKFKPMADNAKYMIANIRAGIRERIALLNAMLSRSSGESIENVQINIAFSLPVNRVEEWQNVASLNGVVSHRKQLEVLSDVEDPAQEEQRLLKEAEDSQFVARSDGTPEEIAARNDAQITQASVEMQPQISQVIDAITDAALAETTRRGGGGA
jgi:SPP1 family phage portal protein